jgi:hypothetical protein
MTRLVTDSNPDGTNASPLALLVGCGCHVPAPDRVVTQPQASQLELKAQAANDAPT